jgi:hypothetical protein
MVRSLADIPLKALVCDSPATAQVLSDALRRQSHVPQARQVSDLGGARTLLLGDESAARARDINTIFIDPLALGLDEASAFIFHIRDVLPEIIFVLYIDRASVESQRAVFYRGERQRFSHFYVLDKRTPTDLFDEELRSVLRTCRVDLSWQMSKAAIERVQDEAARLTSVSETAADQALLQEVHGLLQQLMAAQGAVGARPQPRTARTDAVFLSHRFCEDEYVTGLASLLRREGFEVVTGEEADTYISRAILERISECEYFLCLMTRDTETVKGTYTTSPWLLEEKGAAIALGKRLVLMVEEGVTDIGGLQGDWQRIHFAAKGFLTAAMHAVAQLKQYAGRS